MRSYSLRSAVSSRTIRRRFTMLAAVLVAGLVLASCNTSCRGHVDYTMPPSDSVLGSADALVRASVLGFPNVEEYTLDAELEVTEVLFQRTDGASDLLTEGSLLVGAYDDPCERRSGLRFADDNTALVVLEWVGADGPWSSPWRAFPVLSEDTEGRVTFLDTNQNLNGRVDEILGESTVERLIAVVTEARQ